MAVMIIQVFYMCASDQCLNISLYNKVEKKVRLIKYEQLKASEQKKQAKAYHGDLFHRNQKVLSIFTNHIVFYLSLDQCIGTFVQSYILTVVSEVVPVLDTIIFDGLSAIDLCTNERYIKQIFFFGFSQIVWLSPQCLKSTKEFANL